MYPGSGSLAELFQVTSQQQRQADEQEGSLQTLRQETDDHPNVFTDLFVENYEFLQTNLSLHAPVPDEEDSGGRS